MSGSQRQKEEVLFSVDIEATGPVPGLFSMYQLGACIVGRTDRQFIADIRPLAGAGFIQKNVDACGVTMAQITERGEDPGIAITQFRHWVIQEAAGASPVFAAFGAVFDWMFVEWYFTAFLGPGNNPFGHTALDIKSYYQGMHDVPWGETSMSAVDAEFKPGGMMRNTHDALQDAIEQAEMIALMREYRGGRWLALKT